jgi:hypothetical protein
MRAVRIRTIVIINTGLCLLALLPAFAVQLATVMSGAGSGGGRLGIFVAAMGLFLPGVPVVSIFGSWLTMRWRRITLGFVALPWAYMSVLMLALLALFKG